MELAVAPLGLALNSQFFLPTVNGRIAFSLTQLTVFFRNIATVGNVLLTEIQIFKSDNLSIFGHGRDLHKMYLHRLVYNYILRMYDKGFLNPDSRGTRLFIILPKFTREV